MKSTFSYGFLWFPMVSYGFLWFPMVSYGLGAPHQPAYDTQPFHFGLQNPIVHDAARHLGFEEKCCVEARNLWRFHQNKKWYTLW